MLLRRIEPCFVLKARRQTKTLIYVNICACEHVPLNVNWLRRIQQAASGAADKAARESASAMLSSPIRVDNHIIAMGAAAITAAGVEASSRGWAMQQQGQQQGQQEGQQERSARNVSFSPTCNDSRVEGRASTSSTVRYNQRPSGGNGASRGGATTGGHGRGGGAGDLPGRTGDKGTDGAGEEIYAALDQDDGMDYGGPGLAAVAGGSLIYVLCGEKGATVEGSDVFDVAVHPAVIAAAKSSDRSGAMAKLEVSCCRGLGSRACQGIAVESGSFKRIFSNDLASLLYLLWFSVLFYVVKMWGAVLISFLSSFISELPCRGCICSPPWHALLQYINACTYIIASSL